MNTIPTDDLVISFGAKREPTITKVSNNLIFFKRKKFSQTLISQLM